MGERLIRPRDRERLNIGFEKIESPFFAKSYVRRSLEGCGGLFGLDELRAEFGCYGFDTHNISERQKRKMLETVERGDWLLVLDEPFSPLSRDTSNRYWAITGKRALESVYHPPQVLEEPLLSRVESVQVPRNPVPEKQLRCTFTKPRTLPDGTIDYTDSGGPIPTSAVGDYGTFALLGGYETDSAGNVVLKQIRGERLPAALGTLALGGAAVTAGASCGGLCTAGAVTTGVAGSTLAGLVALLWPSSLGDSSLYTQEQLNTLKQGRTRVRLHVEQHADGTLKGYGYNTQKRPDWEMIPVVQFQARGTQQVADFGDGVTLIWTPAVEPSRTSAIPPLEGAPQAPQIWIYPPTERADSILVSPIYPPEYKDFILVFPAGSGVKPLYIVMNVRLQPGVVTGQGEDVTGIWLAGAGVELGAPIPNRIADQLRGEKFNSFDDFRSAFWIAVASDSVFNQQFSSRNLSAMSKGLAPAAPTSGHAGKRIAFELHHVELIKNGGAVYDVSNLRAVTPKRHIEIHKGGE
ncbi:S-type pyocin domain-containing protein [Pseudomonas sp. L13]|uniref:S-type pyocin domain-containing protein n=1 Tax=Pseudomonas sp. L13 TaxID=343985 RepID=UPI00137B061F|nr:S-type pyocin domain-containing protein [Pseudomonas sp. L13]NCE89788.1 colicin-E3 [Pseudomonas sp. L13]